MGPTVESKNKALVLRAFDTLFNKRDYEAAERYWSPNYIQHSAHIPPGRDGLFDLIRAFRRRLDMSRERLWQKGTLSSCMADSRALACL
jgi:predicted SnoaL-like aldol condensation-catalyzing enzyme